MNKRATKARLSVSMEALGELIGERAMARLTDIAGSGRIGRGNRLVLVEEGSRSQRLNRERCIEKLKELVQKALVQPRVRRRTKPSRSSKERRLGDKKQRGDTKRRRQKPANNE